MKTKRVFGLVFVVMALVQPACARTSNPEREVIKMLDAVATKSFEYQYTESSTGKRVEVRGQIEDSFRRVEVMSINGNPVLERVIS
ncbi:MAG: hypothetical protein ACRD1T_22070, partial [Acidimicrobiia bacterium]